MNTASHSSLALCKGLGRGTAFCEHHLAALAPTGPRVPNAGASGSLEQRKGTTTIQVSGIRWTSRLEGIGHKSEITEVKQVAAADWEGALAVIADELTGLLREAMDWFATSFGEAKPHCTI